MRRLAVVGEPDQASPAELAARLGLPMVSAALCGEGGFDLLLLPGERLELALAGPKAPGGVAVDFADPALARRARGPRGGTPLLARALGLDRGVRTVVDATAGLGRDAFTLAAAGAEVTMVERDAVLLALLADGLRRARLAGVEAAARLRLVTGDAREYLRALPPDARPDAVFIDPMFPDRGKVALPGKDLQVLRALLGAAGEDVEELVAVARAVARRRVVVKRPPHVAALGGRPEATYAGSRVRYDVLRRTD